MARSSIAIRTSSAQSRSSGAKVTRPSRSARSAVSGRPALAPAAASASASAVEAGGQPGQAVAHRQRAQVHRTDREHGRVGARIHILEHPCQLEGAVGGQRQFEQRAGEAAARLYQGDDAAAGDVQPLERALEIRA